MIIDEDKVREIIGIALGRASMCWTDVDKAGVFLSDICIQIIDETVVEISLLKSKEKKAP